MYYLFFKWQLKIDKLLCSHGKDNRKPWILIRKVVYTLLNEKQVIKQYMYYDPYS